jgi:hypothetical protein
MATTKQAAAINAAAQKYGIPAAILWGVYGLETDWGGNVTTSSAGAVGPFQFIPGTARTYNYPLTNSPTDAQFQQQADSAAHYLSDLFHQTRSWDTALHDYSGGGYGLAQVKTKGMPKLLAAPGQVNLHGGTDAQSGGVGGGLGGLTGVGGVGDAISTASTIANTLGSIQFWIRLGEAIAGMILIALGLKAVTGGTVDPVGMARKVAPA